MRESNEYWHYQALLGGTREEVEEGRREELEERGQVPAQPTRCRGLIGAAAYGLRGLLIALMHSM